MPLPAVNRNPKLATAQHRSALIRAGNNLVATRTCQAGQRERFAKGG